jgi:hypothetical protein
MQSIYNFSVVARAILRSKPALEAKLKAVRSLLHYKGYRDGYRRRLLAYRNQLLLQQRLIVPRLSG